MSENESQSIIKESVLPSPRMLLGVAWTLFKKHFRVLVGIQIIPVVCSVILFIVQYNFVMEDTVRNPLVYIILFPLFFILTLIFSYWAQATIIHTLLKGDDSITIFNAYKQTWKKLGAYIWVCILMGFICMAGSFLFIVPGFIFAVWFTFAMFIVIAGEEHGFRALQKSREYVRGKWWPIFGRILAFMLLCVLITIVLVVLLSQFLPLSQEISQFVISLILTPFMMTYMYSLYVHSKSMKGEIPEEAIQKNKNLYRTFAILGILIIPALILLTHTIRSTQEPLGDSMRTAEIVEEI